MWYDCLESDDYYKHKLPLFLSKTVYNVCEDYDRNPDKYFWMDDTLIYKLYKAESKSNFSLLEFYHRQYDSLMFPMETFYLLDSFRKEYEKQNKPLIINSNENLDDGYPHYKQIKIWYLNNFNNYRPDISVFQEYYYSILQELIGYYTPSKNTFFSNNNTCFYSSFNKNQNSISPLLNLHEWIEDNADQMDYIVVFLVDSENNEYNNIINELYRHRIDINNICSTRIKLIFGTLDKQNRYSIAQIPLYKRIMDDSIIFDARSLYLQLFDVLGIKDAGTYQSPSILIFNPHTKKSEIIGCDKEKPIRFIFDFLHDFNKFLNQYKHDSPEHISNELINLYANTLKKNRVKNSKALIEGLKQDISQIKRLSLSKIVTKIFIEIISTTSSSSFLSWWST